MTEGRDGNGDAGETAELAKLREDVRKLTERLSQAEHINKLHSEMFLSLSRAIAVRNRSGVVVGVLAADDELGGGKLCLRHQDGRKRSVTIEAKRTGAELALHDHRGNVAIGLSASVEDGISLNLLSDQGRVLAKIQAHASGGMLAISDATGTPSAFIDVGEAGEGRVWERDAQGNVRHYMQPPPSG